MIKRKSLILTLVFLGITLLDIVLTLIGTPDLKDEGNPISAVLRLGWFALIATNVFAVIVFGLFSHIAFDKYQTPRFTAKNFFEFYLMLFYNTRTMTVKPMLKLPKNWMPFFAMISFSACVSLIAGRLVVVIEWLAVLSGYKHSMYFMIRDNIPFGRTDVWVFILAFLISTLVWMQIEFKKVIKFTKNYGRIDN